MTPPERNRASTDELIDALARTAPPKPASIAFWVAGGAAVALGLIVATIGLRPQLGAALASPEVLVKLAFALGALTGATLALDAAGRPGRSLGAGLGVFAAAGAAIVLIALFDLAGRPIALWPERILGTYWTACLVSIPIYAIPAMLLATAGLRRMAPTDPERGGLVVGLAGGTASAVAYALHCVDDAPAFVAVWYMAGILIATLIGRALAPRLLRW